MRRSSQAGTSSFEDEPALQLHRVVPWQRALEQCRLAALSLARAPLEERTELRRRRVVRVESARYVTRAALRKELAVAAVQVGRVWDISVLELQCLVSSTSLNT